MAGIEDIDITGAVRANRWAQASRTVAAVVWLLGAPLSALALAAMLRPLWPGVLVANLGLAAPIFGVLFTVLLFGLSFAILSLRPLLALGLVMLGTAPAIWAWTFYLFSMEREVAVSLAYSAAYAGPFAAPFLAMAAAAAPLGADLKMMARPAPPMPSFGALAREMFSLWPGMRRGALAAALSGAVSWLASLPLAAAWLALPPLVFVAVSLAPAFLSTHGPGEVAAQAAVIVGLIWIATVSHALLMGTARWLSRASFEDQVRRDGRAPILFLRSFQDDQVGLAEPSAVQRVVRAVFTLGFGRRRLDHILIEQFSRYGPSLALGAPGEARLPFGAARVYADHDSWQDKVAEIAGRARSVVLVADRTPGVEWEIRTFMDGPWREKTVFVCAPKSGDIRTNAVMGERLRALGVAEGGAPVVAAWWRHDGTLRLLRARGAVRPETMIVALQAFFRDQEAEPAVPSPSGTVADPRRGADG